MGATDILVGVFLYLFAILPLNEISQAYMTDAVFFIFGILAVAVGVSKTGQGLWVTYNIIDKMGGRIAVHSQEGKGTIFTVDIPIVIPEKK